MILTFIMYQDMKSKTERVKELDSDGKTSSEIAKILYSEDYSIIKRDGSWDTLTKKEKLQELNQSVRNIKSRFRDTPPDDGIKQLKRKKLELEIEKFETTKDLVRILKD
jgi:hypothetical protein